MCCFSGFLLVGLDVSTVSNLKINYVQIQATLHCCFSRGGGLKVHMLKSNRKSKAFYTHIQDYTQSFVQKKFKKNRNYLVLSRTVGMARYSLKWW